MIARNGDTGVSGVFPVTAVMEWFFSRPKLREAKCVMVKQVPLANTLCAVMTTVPFVFGTDT